MYDFPKKLNSYKPKRSFIMTNEKHITKILPENQSNFNNMEPDFIYILYPIKLNRHIVKFLMTISKTNTLYFDLWGKKIIFSSIMSISHHI